MGSGGGPPGDPARRAGRDRRGCTGGIAKHGRHLHASSAISLAVRHPGDFTLDSADNRNPGPVSSLSRLLAAPSAACGRLHRPVTWCSPFLPLACLVFTALILSGSPERGHWEHCPRSAADGFPGPPRPSRRIVRSGEMPCMATAPGSPAPTRPGRTIHLSDLLKRPITDSRGESLGRVEDVVVRLPGDPLPVVKGLVAKVGGREVFVPTDQTGVFDGEELKLTSPKLDLRRFERRDGEVLLRRDVLGHRLIDVPSAHLIRANDLELRQQWSPDGREEWVLAGVDTRRRPGWLRRLTGRGGGDHSGRRLPGLVPVRAADRARRQRGPARPARPDPPAEAGPDRRPARGRVQGRGARDPGPCPCGSRAGSRRLRGAGGGSGHPAARRAQRRRDRRRAVQDAGR